MAQLVAGLWKGVDRMARVWLFLALAALFAFFSMVIFPMHQAYYRPTVSTLDARPFGFGPGEAVEAIEAFNEAELVAYGRQELITDLVFPVVYALMCAVGLVLLGRVVRVPAWLVLVPFVTALADYTENVSIALMIVHRLGGQPFELFATIGSVGSRFKHIGLYSLAILLVGFALAAAWRRWSAPRVARASQ